MQHKSFLKAHSRLNAPSSLLTDSYRLYLGNLAETVRVSVLAELEFMLKRSILLSTNSEVAPQLHVL